jgi:hypothetical protein
MLQDKYLSLSLSLVPSIVNASFKSCGCHEQEVLFAVSFSLSFSSSSGQILVSERQEAMDVGNPLHTCPSSILDVVVVVFLILFIIPYSIHPPFLPPPPPPSQAVSISSCFFSFSKEKNGIKETRELEY